MPRAGRIRLGEKEINDRGKEYPRELDYFNCTDAPLVGQIYGEKPREIDIILPINDKRAIADTCYMRYGASGPKCRGNGVTAWDMEKGASIECFGEDCEYVDCDKPSCKRQMIFTFVCFRVPGLCVHDVVTSGWRSIENVLAFLDTLEGLFGRIDGIPLKMYREPYETTRTDKDGKRRKQVHHCIRLDVAASLLDVKRLQLAGGQDLALPEPPAECADDMYPRSLQGEAPALPPVPDAPTDTGVVIESPPLAAVPDDPDLANVITGFDVVGITDPGEQKRLLDAYEGRLPELNRYLGSLLTDQLPPAQAPSQPARAPRYDQEREPTIESPKTPAPAKPKGRPMF